MASLNKFLAIGNITGDLQLKSRSNGSQMLSFGLAINEQYQANGEMKKETSFFDVKCFGVMAENIAKYCKKGTPIYLEGKMKQEQWESQGQKRSKLVFFPHRFQILNFQEGKQ